MPGFPCGNNPHQQLTPGDAQALDEFRTFLEERAQDGTRSSVDRARAALQRFASVPGFIDAIECFEAAVRANERNGGPRTVAELMRCTCDYIAEPWISMDHKPGCPIRPGEQQP